MSHLDRPEEGQLALVADELHEAFSADGVRVTSALGQHSAFGSRNGLSRSSLRRDLAVDAIVRGASVAGVDVVDDNGAIDLVTPSHPLRRYRVRRMTKLTEDGPLITWSSESVLGRDDDSLMPTQWWVFTYRVSEDETITDVLVASVERCIPGKPGHLVLGKAYPLGGSHTPPPSFPATDEDLDLGIDEEDEAEFG